MGKLLSPGIFVFLLGLAVTGIQKEFSETELRCERGHVAKCHTKMTSQSPHAEAGQE